MRNLKRALSLALAAVMVLAMMVVGAGAMSINDFADKDEIVNQDAVALMVDLGVLEGLDGPNGTTIFQPKATLQRQAMAKIAYMVATGATDWDVYATASPKFTDLSGSWAQGAIEYCNLMGYITGYTDTVFGPADTLTVAQTATVLLRVLGYDNEAQGYSGDSWMISAMRDAKANGLLNGVSNTVAGSPISRQDACQMAYNALFANTRTANKGVILGEPYFQGYTVHNTTLGEESYNLKKISGQLTGITAAGKAQIDGATSPLTATPNMVGSNVVYFVNKNTGALISSALAVGNSTILGTSTSGATLDQLSNPNGAYAAVYYLASADDAVLYFENGVKKANAEAVTIKAGSIVELVDNNGNGKYDVVRVTTKEVGVVPAAGVVVANNKVVIGEKTYDAKKVTGYEDLEAGDYFLYVTVGGVTYIDKASSVSGQITSSKTANNVTTYNMSGVGYKASGLVDDPFKAEGTQYAPNTDLVLYLDDNGGVIAITAVKGEEVTPEYAVVLKLAWVTGDGSLTASQYAQAQLLLADGTTEIVRLASVKAADAEKATVLNKDAIKDQTGNDDTEKLGALVNEGDLYAYTSKDGQYALTALAEYSEGSAGTKAIANDGKIDRKVAFATDMKGNSATKFIIRTTINDTDTYSVVTGYANAPVFSGEEGNKATGVAYLNKSGFATLVYISNGEKISGSETEQTVYFLSTNYEQILGKNGYKVFDAIVDGTVGTVKVASDVTVENAGLAKVTYNDDGIVTAVAEATATKGEGTTKAANEVVGIGENFYSYNTDTVVFFIDAITGVTKGTVADITSDEDDTVVYTIVDKTDTLDTVYITKVTTQTPGEDDDDDEPTTTGLTVTEFKATASAGKVTFTGNVTTENIAKVTVKVTPSERLNDGSYEALQPVTSEEITLDNTAFSYEYTCNGGTYKFSVEVNATTDNGTITWTTTTAGISIPNA